MSHSVLVARAAVRLEVKRHNLKPDELYILTVYDANCPNSNIVESLKQLCKHFQDINDARPFRSSCLFLTPDKPRPSSTKGLHDEIAAIETQLWVVHQMCDTRFVVNYDMSNRTMRRWTGGDLQ